MSRKTHALVGNRIELNPVHPRWAKGDKFGLVTGTINGGKIQVQMDSGKVITIKPTELRHS
jgi:hypothetical protein